MNRIKTKNKKERKNMSSAASGDCVDYTQTVVGDKLKFEQLLKEYERLQNEAAERLRKEKEATERLKADFARRLEESEARVQKMLKERRKYLEEREQLLLKLDALSRHENSENSSVQDIYSDVLKQREEISQMFDLVSKNVSSMKAMRNAMASGRCTQCAHALNDLSEPLPSIALSPAVECQDDLRTRTERCGETFSHTVLFSNGRAIEINSNTESSAFSSRFQGPSDPPDEDGDDLLGAAAAAGGHPHSSHALQFRQGVPSALALTRGAQLGIVEECPLCGCDGFRSVEELTYHVDAHFAEQFDDSDWGA